MYLLCSLFFSMRSAFAGMTFMLFLQCCCARLTLTLVPLRLVIITWYYMFKLRFRLLACLSSFPHEPITFYFIFLRTPLSLFLFLSRFFFFLFFCAYTPVVNCTGGVPAWTLLYIVGFDIFLTIYSVLSYVHSPYSLDPHLLGLTNTPGDT
jgi:hypothetical protein